MRARQRHFNPGSAGAVLALDSRFIFGVDNANPVSTWTDRSGFNNNATASTVNRPNLETNQQGGQPSVKFNGTSNVMGFTGISAGVEHTSITVLKLAPNFGPFNFGGVLGGNTNSIAPIYVYGNNIASINMGYTISTGGASSTFNASSEPWRICATSRNGASVNIFVSNQNEISATLPANTSAFIVNLGARTTGASPLYYNSYVSAAIMFAPRPSASVYARIRHLLAYSFKIPCS